MHSKNPSQFREKKTLNIDINNLSKHNQNENNLKINHDNG